MSEKLTSNVFEVCVEGYHSIYLPEKEVEPFVNAGHKRARFIASFEGNTFSFHGALKKIKGRYTLTFGKNYQKELGIYPTDYFDLQIVEDTTKYGVEMPEELQAVLDSDPEAMEIFESFTDGKKRSLIYYILRFKNSQTRIDKALIITENMKMGITEGPELIKPRSR